MSQAKPHSVLEQYEQLIAAGTIRSDMGQYRVAKALDTLLQHLKETSVPPARRGLLGLLAKTVPLNAGLYLWGDVGRGKSMLMDMFVAAASPLRATMRVHFHAFMLDVHKRLFLYRQKNGSDALERVTAEIAQEIRVLCLDEFQVSDVADAMILSRLFAGLMDAGVVTVFTSNRPPHELYQGGLQREQFLQFVALLKTRMVMLELGGAEDYRMAQHRSLARRYVYPDDGSADDFLLESWRVLTGNAASEPIKLSNDGRILRVEKQAQGIAWLTFEELCTRPLGASDYLMLARLFHTILLQGIPQLMPEDRNEAKRFVTLIDALYDHRVKLVATAATEPDSIYAFGDGNFEFHRTVSRLHEMQGDSYLKLAHIA
jgi:cell division protein ZapE